MNYLMIVCNDGLEASEPEERLVAETFGQYIAETADVDVFGHPLERPASAKTVRVREGQTLVSDGPFVETKEHIAGFSLLDCEAQEQAIRAAAAHPLAWFNKIEVRPLAEEAAWSPDVLERLENGPAAGLQRFMLLICSDGVPTPAKRETVQRELPTWLDRVTASGARVTGLQLAPPDTAVTVRVRGPHTLVTDGPFVETKEFMAGFDVIDCAGIDEAIAIAAAHPVSWFHMIEVRPFTLTTCDEPPAEGAALTEAGASAL